VRFAYTMIFVRDVGASAEFYAGALGLMLDHVDDDGSYAEFETGSTKLGLVSNDHARAHLRVAFRENRISDSAAGFEL
jgi:lactoylglutathione lyase